MNESRKTPHHAGRRRATDRQQPRRSKRDVLDHTDKYAAAHQQAEDDRLTESLRELAAHFNGQEADHA